MSKIALSGNPAGSGTFTIASPNSNTDRTLTLPDATGTVALTSQIPAAPTIASTAEAQAGTNNTNFITPLRLFEAFQGSNFSAASSGYQRLPSGILIQWVLAGSTTNTSGTVSFSWPISFPSSCFAAVPAVSGDTSDAVEIGTSRSTSGGTITFSGAASGITKTFVVIGVGV